MKSFGIKNMLKSLIAIFTAASVLLSSKVTCQKPPEPPKDKDGKPLPPPEGKKPPTGSDGKPLPPPDGCKPPEHDKTKG